MPVINTPETGDDDQPDDGNGEHGGAGNFTPPPPPPPAQQQVKVMDGERVAFIEESQPGQYLKLIASGAVDDFMLEALEDYVKRQRKRLASEAAKPS